MFKSSENIKKKITFPKRFLFLFPITTAGVVPRGGHKKSPRTSSIAQIIFSFRSFEISEDILRNQKNIVGLYSFSKQGFNIFSPIWILLVFVSTTLLIDAKLQ